MPSLSSRRSTQSGFAVSIRSWALRAFVSSSGWSTTARRREGTAVCGVVHPESVRMASAGAMLRRTALPFEYRESEVRETGVARRLQYFRYELEVGSLVGEDEEDRVVLV